MFYLMVMPSEPAYDPDVVSGRPTRLSAKDDRAAHGLAVLRSIKTNIDPDMVAEILTNAMNSRTYDRLGRDVGPDYKTALRAVEIYINQTVGLPVQRIESVTTKAGGSDADVLEKILANPAARGALGKILAKFNDNPKTTK